MAQILTHIHGINALTDALRAPAQPSVPLTRHLEETDGAVRGRLRDVLRETSAELPDLMAVLQHSLATKRNYDRAWFIRLGYEAVDADWVQASALMCAAELTYASVVILDDIVDGGTMRFGKPCLHVSLGTERAIYIAEILRSLGRRELLTLARNSRIPASTLFAIMLSEEQAFRDLNYGQFRDLEMSTMTPDAVDDDDVLELLRLTTGVDIGNCLAVGALAGGASEALITTLRSLGEKIGVLLQVRDDLLDYADPSLIDKGNGCDFAQHRMKLPFVVAMRHGAPEDRMRLESATIKDWEAVREIVLRDRTLRYIIEIVRSLQSSAITLTESLHGSLRELLREFVSNVIAIE